MAAQPILLLGATGYIGQAFARELERRGKKFIAPLRKDVDYTSFETLLNLVRETKPGFLINSAGYTGKPNVDACELAKADTLQGNALFPQTVSHACLVTNTPWGHVSSGCVFSGAKIVEGKKMRVEKDMTKKNLHDLAEKKSAAIRGFTETDEPNFTFQNPPCSFYSGSKALAEKAIAGTGRNYIWRLRIPFDRFDNTRNYLSKLQRYPKIYENVNSISHRADFVNACLDLWEMRSPFGIYNVTNPGFVTTRHVVEMVQKILRPKRKFEFWKSDEEFYRIAAKTPRSNCVLDVSKLLKAGIKIRHVEDALEDSLKKWKPEN